MRKMEFHNYAKRRFIDTTEMVAVPVPITPEIINIGNINVLMLLDPPGSNLPTEKTITLTLATSAPGQASQQLHSQGPTGGIGTPLIVSSTNVIPSVPSGLGGLASASSSASQIQHGPVSIHYAGSGISATTMPQCLQSKTWSGQNFVLGTGGPPLLVSGSTVLSSGSQGIGGLAAVSGASSGAANHASVIPPYATSLGTPLQGSLTKMPSQAPTTQSYVVTTGSINASNVCGPDSGDEGVPVSIHVTNSLAGDPTSDGGPHSAGQSEQRLKVEDALNYLDQVKYKFGNQPQVYNDFLDIMKEFKSQSIDTPGVISRVSHLFRGHPELIMGFNTFLPPGYKIEVQMNDQLPIGSMSHGMNYKVTTVHTTGLLNQHSSTTLVQQHPAPSIPVRSTVTHSTHPGSTSGPYVGSGGSVNNSSVTQVGSVGITNSRALSPVRPPSLPPSGNSFESVGGSAFTHSLASPFVQNAFPTLQSQPVEFNHAITYVNKIKNRFHTQPDKYKQFLEILHTYQKEQRNSKDGSSSKHLTEHEVYNQVAKLFENQEDLLQEFGQFLPDATPPPPPVSSVSTARQNLTMVKVLTTPKEVKRPVEEAKKPAKVRQEYQPTVPAAQPPPKPVATAPKRSIINTSLPSAKKVKYTSSSFKDVSLAEAGKYGTLNDFAFFDKVRHLLRSSDVYDNFLRVLLLFNDEVISRSEVLQLTTPFLSKAPELLAWFKDFLGHNDQAATQQYEPVQSVSKQEKLTEEQVLEIDFSTCKRLGASYCALPKNHMPPKCSGRTALCREVLNDVWVSFPTWSEDSTFVTSRKTQFEEYIYRCEDERFELDVVIETNTETIRCLEAVSKKMSRMTQEDLQEFQLDDCLGGTSPTIHQRAIRRLYGEKASDIIEGLKKLPSITVPMVLKRLKAKEEEWREAQKGFNKIWREQIERFYLKSLDHQGINFKQGDIRALRSKALITEIETVYDERQEQNAVESATDAANSEGPHLRLPYRDRSVLDDACNLLLHHVRRQSGIQKEDKRKIKQILKHFVPDLFDHARMEMSDDENEEGSPDDDRRSPPIELFLNGNKNNKRTNGSAKRSFGVKLKKEDDTDDDLTPSGRGTESRRTIAKRELKINLARGKRGRGKDKQDEHGQQLTMDDLKVLSVDTEELQTNVVQHVNQNETYRMFYVNNTWYVFLRLHQILCERLTKLLETANALALSEPKETRDNENSAAIMLRLKPKPEIEIEEYYPTFLEMVRNLLDGNMETNMYEDQLREMFGIHAYIAYTMDKVVANAVRQLQNLVTDEGCQKCLELYHFAHRHQGTGGPVSTSHMRVKEEVMYQRKAERAFGDENCVKVILFHKNCEMTMELMDGEPQSPATENQTAWFSYVGNYVSKDGPESQTKLLRNPMYLRRNKRKPTTVNDIKKEPESCTEKSLEGHSVRVKEEPDEDDDIVHESTMQCSFNPSSYKMVYLINGEDFLYRRNALPKAHETHKLVSLGMLNKFEKWHEDWLLKNTTRKDRSDCEAWLKESPKSEADIRAKRILKVAVTDQPDKVPYRQYKKYNICTVSSKNNR